MKILAIILDSLDITMNNLLKPFGTKLRSHLVSFHGKIGIAFSTLE